MGKIILSVLAAASLLATATFAQAEPGWSQRQLTAQQRYLACRARISKEPPCTQNWTRYCARQCGARYL